MRRRVRFRARQIAQGGQAAGESAGAHRHQHVHPFAEGAQPGRMSPSSHRARDDAHGCAGKRGEPIRQQGHLHKGCLGKNFQQRFPCLQQRGFAAAAGAQRLHSDAYHVFLTRCA